MQPGTASPVIAAEHALAIPFPVYACDGLAMGRELRMAKMIVCLRGVFLSQRYEQPGEKSVAFAVLYHEQDTTSRHSTPGHPDHLKQFGQSHLAVTFPV